MHHSRHDLRPVTSNTSATENPENAAGAAETIGEGSELPPPLAAEQETEGASSSNPRRRTRLLDLNRLRHAAPDERIAALRQLREQSQREGEASEGVEETSRRTRLTNRLRDRFHIRTRAETAVPPASSSST